MSVLLGIADEEIYEGDDKKLSWDVNKLGGSPNWISGRPKEYPTCNLCGRFLYLIVQIYCPLDRSQYHRALYIFACVELDCWDNASSWKVLRGQLLDKKSCDMWKGEEKAPHQRQKEDDWCDHSADWGVEDEVSESVMSSLKNEYHSENSLQILEDSTARLTIGSPGEAEAMFCTTESCSEGLPSFIPRYIVVVEEPLEEHNMTDDSHVQSLIDNYERESGVVDPPEGDVMAYTTESYEKCGPIYSDSNFHKFRKRIARASSQCLRYQWRGEPLLLTSKTDPSTKIHSIPDCPFCHAPRVFELQILPSISWFLREKNMEQEDLSQELCRQLEEQEYFNGEICARQECIKSGSSPLLTDTRLELGSVYVYSCSESCWNSNDSFPVVREEFPVVHADPDRYITAKGK